MKRFAWMLLAWYVITYSGKPVAGPFTLLGDCTDVAKIMNKKDSKVSAVCQFKA